MPTCIVSPQRLPSSSRMADHDRRRKAMKRQRLRARRGGGMHANQQKGIHRYNFESDFLEIKVEEYDYGDLDDLILHDLFHTYLDLTAKAA
ncbi:hypothetical protein JHK82_031024 [Glycine max]|nr:hypothetical protein JHK85_031670 [Glycine max]KAG4994291.1 hypothetical protein JHK86_031118 [Glycine max]KAG5124287.1 hypothetical protein JHK82_031024 [Glycine max]KAG5145704.1 hypothetical protein JHK84_031247 [Glycine max]